MKFEQYQLHVDKHAEFFMAIFQLFVIVWNEMFESSDGAEKLVEKWL